MKEVTFVSDVGDDFRMEPAIKKEWLEALRSGDYQQGRGRLKLLNGSYCCLGVLCLIHGRHQEKVADFAIDENGVWHYTFDYDGKTFKTNVLPGPSIYEWAGLNKVTKKNLQLKVPRPDDGEDYVTTPSPAGFLSTLNDTYRFSFPEIANYIEKYL